MTSLLKLILLLGPRAGKLPQPTMEVWLGGCIGGSSSSLSLSNPSNESVGSERLVRVEESVIKNRRVEMSSTSSINLEDVNEVNLPEDDWVVTEVKTAYSKYRSIVALRVLLDTQDILDRVVPNHIFSLR